MKLKYLSNLIFLTIILVLSSCNNTNTELMKKPKISLDTLTNKPLESKRQIFELTKQKYDTLIPIFDGLFITYSNYDTASRRLLNSNPNLKDLIGMHLAPKDNKWGVIDSAEKIIVPFIGDAAKAISDKKGVLSVSTFHMGMNTGIERYEYWGNCYSFSKQGLDKVEMEEFKLRIKWEPMHKPEFVIDWGNEFFLPKKYRKQSDHHDD